MARCIYTKSMSVPNLKQIGRKTRQKWPKNRQNGRFYVITSRRRYVMTSFFIWYDVLIPCPCLYQIWSKSVGKHGHSGPKTARNGPKLTFLRPNVATLLRHDVFFHMLRCAYTMPMSSPNLKRIRRKTRPQWPKNRQNGPKSTFLRHNVTTSLRHQNFNPLTTPAPPTPTPCPSFMKIHWAV